MKTTQATALLSLATASALTAGQMMSPYDSMAQQAPMAAPTACEAFSGGWALAPYALFLTPDADYDTTFGFGIGAEYFFNTYLGLAGSGQWAEIADETYGNYAVDVVARYPVGSLCLAPYAYAGLGLINGNDETNLLVRVGIGVDWRFYNGHGLFADWSYTAPGGGGGEDDWEDYQTIRLGVKIDF